MVDIKKIIGTIINTLHVDIENAVTKFTKYMLGADSVKRMMTEFSKKYPAAAHRTVKDLPRVAGFLIGRIKDEYFLTKEAADMVRASFNEIAKTVADELARAGDISSERFEQIVDEQIKKMDELPVVADLMGVTYHKPICFVLDNLDADKKKPLTWAKAIDGGYKACQHCYRCGAEKSKKDPAQKMPFARDWILTVAVLGILTFIVALGFALGIGGDKGQLVIRVGGSIAIAALGIAFLMVKFAVTGLVLLVPRLTEADGEKINRTVVGLTLWCGIYIFLCMMVPIWESVPTFALMTACVFMGMMIVHRGWFQGRIFKYLVSAAVVGIGGWSVVRLSAPGLAHETGAFSGKMVDAAKEAVSYRTLLSGDALADAESDHRTMRSRIDSARDEMRKRKSALVTCVVDECPDRARLEQDYRQATDTLRFLEGDVPLEEEEKPEPPQPKKKNIAAPAESDGIAEADALLKNLGF